MSGRGLDLALFISQSDGCCCSDELQLRLGDRECVTFAACENLESIP